MTAAKKLNFISIDDYLKGELVSEVKHEYFDGIVYAMAGARNVHNTVAMAFTASLHAQLRGKPCQVFNSDTKVRVRLPRQTRFYYPDGMIVCSPNRPDDTFQDSPVVIAEVISEATRRIDEGEKKEAYLTIPSLSAYAVIQTDRPRVVVHRRGADGTFAPELYEGVDSVIDFDDVGCSVRLSELYERVDFSATPAADESAQ